jgi:carboxymethylenebutenolidase
MGEMIDVNVSSGGARAYLAPARTPSGPPVLLLHPWWGLNQAIRELADRLGGDGFTVLAPDLFDGIILTTPDEAEAHVKTIGAPGGLSHDRIRATAAAALDALLARPEASGDRAGIIGLSLGAGYAQEIAEARAEVVAFVGIYPGIFEAPAGVAYLGHYAQHDAFDDSAEVENLKPTLREGSAAYVYPDTKHWFMESDRPEFDVGANDLAYQRTVEFLRRELG